MHIIPLAVEVFQQDNEFTCDNCANFEILNVGQTTVVLANHVELKAGFSEFFPSIGTLAYKGSIPFRFKSEDGKINKILIKASKYDGCH